MIQYVPPDEDEEDADYRYARVDAHRQPLARQRWTRLEIGVPLGAVSAGLSLLCLIGAIVGVVGGVPIDCCIRDSPPAPEDMPETPLILKMMPWVCVGSAFLGLYAYFKSDDADDKTGLIGALLGGVAFLAWVVVRVLGKMQTVM